MASVQKPPGATEGTQLSLSAKSGLLETILLMFNVTEARLVNVMFCGGLVVPTVWVGKLRLLGEKETAEVIPAPFSETVCGLSRALSVTITDPLSAPSTPGAKVT